MSLATLRNGLGDYAKDIKLNLGNVLSEEGAADLTQNQIYTVALSSAYATKNEALISSIYEEVSSVLSDAEIHAAKAAATIMGMNNIYYRFTHLVGDKEYSKLPAHLRMQVIGNPGIPKVEFELLCLAVSAINGCGMCMEAHVHEVTKGGISRVGVQSSIRIAAVINAAAQAIVIEQVSNPSSAQAA